MSDDAYEALLRHFNLAPCGYVTTALDGQIVSANQTFLTMSGFSRHDLVGRRRFVDLLTGGGRIYHETHFLPMLTMTGDVRELAMDLLCADGSRLPVLVNASVDHDPDGATTYIRLALFDAAERRRYERELVAEKKRAEDALADAAALARTLERTLIPPRPPQTEELQVEAAYRPAGVGHQVGGDFYDVFQVGTDEWVVALGDVAGKGTEAAVVTSLARYVIRSASMLESRPSRTLSALNDALLAEQSTRHCTVVLVRLARSSPRWRVSLSCGGHPRPILIDEGGTVSRVGRHGTLLGVIHDPRLYDEDFDLHPGQSLVAFTDGLSEGRKGPEFYGESRVTRSAARHAGTAAELVEGLVGDVLQFQDGIGRDDLAVVAIHVPEPGVPPPIPHD